MIKHISINRRFRVVLAACLLCYGGAAAPAAGVQSLASIRLQAEAFILEHPYQSPYPPRFELGKLDSRLRLKPCRQALDVSFARTNVIYGNSALTVRCPVKPGWKIHLPVRIEVFDDVVIAAKPLLKGQKIDDSAVAFAKRDIARLKNGYYSEPGALQQLQVRRNLKRGTVLTPANLAPRMLVRSGQQVTLVLNYNGLQVKSSGKALGSASIGEQVRVRNSQSQKIIEGVVSGDALVQVSL